MGRRVTRFALIKLLRLTFYITDVITITTTLSLAGARAGV